MTKTRNLMIGLAAGAALLTSAAASLAQPPQPPGQGPGLSNGGQRPPPRADGPRDPAQRAERLHEQLGITTAQDAAFKAWLDATRPDAATPPEDMQAMTTPERLNRQLGDLQTRVRATTTFYNQLTAEQKAKFDKLPPMIALGEGPGGRGGRGPGVMAAMREGRAERGQALRDRGDAAPPRTQGGGGYGFR